MFNDLWLSKNQKNMLWQQGAFSAGGDPLLDEFRYGIKKLARVMARMPNSVFVGPGNARLWEMDPHFDRAANGMLSILDGYGVTNINVVEMCQTMENVAPSILGTA